MNWIELWQAIAARIAGLMAGADFLLQTYAISNQNTGEVGRLLAELKQIHEELRKLYEHYHAEIPSLAAQALEQYCKEAIPTSSASGDATELQLLARLPTRHF